ncbi:unnamed protein product [Caenorhabditis angaria]|uniref:BHLH domain-containing protein n=1 Tax=Caenorhabditis angaria TaxID=860376 RepID=A0A9P1IGR2_9PELO|nr:unnamed protein product [Caenorhabditis angaria]
MSSFRAQVIHSGHFMTSNLHNDIIPDDDDEDIEVDVVEDDDKIEEAGSSHKKQKLDEKPVTFYKFGPTKTQSIAIDISLNKLNKCIQVAYNKMTTPKWKDFKGLRLHWKQRIRLNNVIWRAYYIEFRKNKPAKPTKPFCYFAVPDDDTTHQKIEGSVMEGMYWKRRMEAVCAQYKRWRIRSRNSHYPGMIHNCSSSSVSSLAGVSNGNGRGKKRGQTKIDVKIEPPAKLMRSMTPKHCVSNEWAQDWDFDDLNNVFTDELFDSLSQPYAFPNPKETWPTSNADIIQPGLISLQPTIEEIMANLKDFPESPPLPDPARRKPTAVTTASQAPPQQPHIILPPERRAAQPRPSAPIPTSAPKQDYLNAAMLDYMMPTRQSSAITSQMLMLGHTASVSTAPPSYATSSNYTNSTQFMQNRNASNSMNQHPNISHNNPYRNHMSGQFVATLPSQQQQTSRHPIATTSNDQYMPQFLQQSPQQHNSIMSNGDPMMAPSRSWWMDSPLTASVQSPLSIATPLPLATLVTAPQTPLGQLMGGGAGNNSPPPTTTNNYHQQLKIGGTLTQRLEQPPITTTSYSNPNSINNRIRTISENEWNRPTILSDSSAFESPGIMRQTSCDPSMLQKPEEKPSTVSNASVPEAVPKEEPTLMSAPASVKLMRRQVPDSTLHPEERKRILHLHAEQNRRMALKDGFDQLMEILPDLRSGGVKPTNAVVLAKAAEHIRKLQREKWEKAEKIAEVKAKIEKLNQKMGSLQTNLPASSCSGATNGNGQIDTKAGLESFFERYSKEESKKDWRFWVLSQMLQPICTTQPNSFAAKIAPESASRSDLAASCSDWLHQNWKVTELRPLASSLLVRLATTSNIITDGGASLQEYVAKQLKNPF